jgi:sugar/nucleoside kinase (ribokinase family)
MARKLIVYGDVVVDVLVQISATPHIGQDAIVDHIALMPGGAAANCAVTAARLGTPVEVVGVTGYDHLAHMLVEDLRSHGVGTRYLLQAEGPTAICIDTITKDGERTFYSFRGASARVPYGNIPPDLIGREDCLHVSGYSFQDEYSRETALALMAQARQSGALISLDPSFHFAREFGGLALEVLADIDFIFPNREEARLMGGADDPQEAASAIYARGPRTAVVKLGQQGCYIASPQAHTYVPAYPAAQAVDTTGAGDAFCGGFLTAILWGLGAPDAAKVGHAAAVRVIGERGGHRGCPTLDEVIEFASEHGDEALASALGHVRQKPLSTRKVPFGGLQVDKH